MQALPPTFVRRRVCRTSCIATTRTCVRHLSGNLLAAVRRCWSVEVRSSHVDQCHNLSSTFTRDDVRQHHCQRLQRLRRRVQLWPCVCFIFFATHLARALGFPGCPLSVSAHPVLTGAFPGPRGHVSLWALSCTSCGEECRLHPLLSSLFLRLQLLLSQLFLLCSGNLTYPCSCVFFFLRQRVIGSHDTKVEKKNS